MSTQANSSKNLRLHLAKQRQIKMGNCSMVWPLQESSNYRLKLISLEQAEHLAHWGINMMSMEKTVKTMTELQIDLNMSYEFDKITESGSALQPLSGPGYAS